MSRTSRDLMRTRTHPATIAAFTVSLFVNRFLLNQTSANTNVARDLYNTDLTKWITWSTPTLQ